eukprot:TRINITY_DN11508_c0_g1_i2.p1 TRINITY_DN11508_c0_g1~~TRINITY_DN11508_c0_g1_i2.p1  ORF type:complete len:1212 (+),score=418.90 TRINITY_DN11508_c0_g1_i2:110-3745(+)
MCIRDRPEAGDALEGTFPRGGTTRAPEASADEPAPEKGDFLFGVAEKPKEANTERKRRNEEAPEEAEKKRKKEKPAKVERMSFAQLSIGTAMLGAVKEARNSGLTISLPNQLTGFVRYERVSDVIATMYEQYDPEAGVPLPDLAEMFPEGSIVHCVIVGMDTTQGKRRLELSLKASDLNQELPQGAVKDGAAVYATVRSKEDRGWLLDLGVHGLQGFVPNDSINKGDPMIVGTPKLCAVVTATKGTKALVLSATTAQVLAGKVKKASGFHHLIPGSALTCRLVDKVGDSPLRQGYKVSILDGRFEASIDWQHATGVEIKKGKDVMARVLCINYEDKQVSLTVDPFLMNLSVKPIPSKLKLGQVLVGSVTCVDEGVGLSLTLPLKKNSTDAFHGYAHISQAAEDFVKSLTRSFDIGSTHKCRILSFNRLEGVAVLTLKPSVLEQAVLSHADVSPGMLLDVVVVQPQTHGLKVKLTDSITGFIPIMHLSDRPAADNGTLKFTTGQTIKARVLTVDPVKRSVILTLKRSMVASEFPALTSFDVAQPGEAYHGYVSSAKPAGMFVSFYDSVFGMIPKAELDLFSDAMPKVGGVVKVWLRQVSGNRLRFGLSAVQGSANTTKSLSTFDQVEIGEITNATVAKILETALVLTLENGASGVLPVEHLSDHSSVVALLLESIVVGAELGEVLVLEKDQSKRKLMLSRKASLLAAVRREGLPSKVDQMSTGEVYPGFIKNVHKYGAFVSFMNRASGLAPKRQIADVFVSEVEEHFQPGQSVNALVNTLEEGKVSLSLKASECPEHPDAPEPVQTFFNDRELAATLARKASGAVVDTAVWEQLAIGSVVDAQVMSVHDYGTVMSLLGDVVGFVKAEQHGGQQCVAGETVQCRVVDVAQDQAIVDLSLKLVGGAKPKKRKRETSAKMQASVELIKEDYLVLSLADGSIGFALTNTFNNRVGEAHDLYSYGQKLSVSPAGDAAPNRMLLAINHKTAGSSSKTPSKHDSVDPEVKGVADIKLGMLTKAKVVDTTAAVVNVLLSRGIKGRIHHSQCAQEPADLVAGQLLDVRVLSKGFGKGGRMYELSSLADVLSAEELPRFDTIESIKEGKKLTGFVESISGDSLSIWVSPLLRGRMPAVEASTDVSVASELSSNFELGQQITCYVTKVEPQRSHLDLSVLAPKLRVASVGALRLACLLYTSDAADEEDSVDLGGRRFIQNKRE